MRSTAAPLPPTKSNPNLPPKHPPLPPPLHNPHIPHRSLLINLHFPTIPTIQLTVPRAFHTTIRITIRTQSRPIPRTRIITAAFLSVFETHPAVPLGIAKGSACIRIDRDVTKQKTGGEGGARAFGVAAFIAVGDALRSKTHGGRDARCVEGVIVDAHGLAATAVLCAVAFTGNIAFRCGEDGGGFVELVAEQTLAAVFDAEVAVVLRLGALGAEVDAVAGGVVVEVGGEGAGVGGIRVAV